MQENRAGAMLTLRHPHEWKKGFNCGRALFARYRARDSESQVIQSSRAGGRADYWPELRAGD
jgi:hypothetical protein